MNINLVKEKDLFTLITTDYAAVLNCHCQELKFTMVCTILGARTNETVDVERDKGFLALKLVTASKQTVCRKAEEGSKKAQLFLPKIMF